MSAPEERIAALELEVENLRQHLLTFMEASSKAAEVQTSLVAENLLLSRAITFLGLVWGQDPRLPPGLLKDVYGMTVNDVGEDIKALALRTMTNLGFWNR